MNNRMKIGLLALSIVAAPGWMTPAFAAPADQPKVVQDKSPAFHGTVDAVDTTANTLTVAGKVINVTADSKLTKADKAITLGDIKVGDKVHGTTKETADGKTEALTVKVSPSNEAKPK